MPAVIILRNKEFEVECGQQIKTAMKKIGFSPESHLVMRDGELITENEMIRKNDRIKLISVISGG